MKRALKQAILAPAVIGMMACSSAGTVERTASAPEPAAAHEHPVAEPAQAQASAHPGFTAADVKFMQDMIGHHAQALVMAAMAPTHGAGPQLLRLAQKIDISQADEIGMMKDWLIERKQALPDEAHLHHMQMPGMLTPEQLARLDGARGREFERLFLTFMIGHHEGALRMVDELFASPGAAQDSDIFRFVTDVAADQLDEIHQMKYMLELLAANQGSESR